MTCRRRAGVSIGNYVVPWQIRHAFRVRLRRCSLLCAAAGDADCHVASLLAMTVGKRPCKRRRVTVFSMSLRTSAHTGVAIRVPAVRHNKSAVLWANPQLFRICRKELRSVLHYRRRTDCPVASLLAMTSINLPRFSTIRNRVLHTAFPAGGFPCCSFSCKDADCRSPCSFGYHCIIRPLI